RPRGDAIFRASRSGASGRSAAPSRFGGARGVFARGEQRRILAGRGADPLSRLLLLHLSGTGGLRGGGGGAGGSVLQQGPGRVHPAVRRGADVPVARPHAPRVLGVDVRGGRRSGGLGS